MCKFLHHNSVAHTERRKIEKQQKAQSVTLLQNLHHKHSRAVRAPHLLLSSHPPSHARSALIRSSIHRHRETRIGAMTTTIAPDSDEPQRKAVQFTATDSLLHAAALSAHDSARASPPVSPALSSASSSMGSEDANLRLDGSSDPHRHIKRLGRDNRSISERKLFTPTADKLVLVMVGLPARGKSFIAKKLWKFLCWKGLKCEVFNVGQLRRALYAGTQDHTFFDPNNAQAKEERELLARQSLQQVQDWFLGSRGARGGDVAVFDATNTTKRRRQTLLETFDAFAKDHKMSVHVVFIESICTNEAVINANITQKVTSSPDYRHMSVDEAIADLQLRMKNYEAAYEALEDGESVSYIKLFDLQSKVHAKGMYVSICLACVDTWLRWEYLVD